MHYLDVNMYIIYVFKLHNLCKIYVLKLHILCKIYIIYVRNLQNLSKFLFNLRKYFT